MPVLRTHGDEDDHKFEASQVHIVAVRAGEIVSSKNMSAAMADSWVVVVG